MFPHCKIKAIRRNIPNGLVHGRLRVRPIHAADRAWHGRADAQHHVDAASRSRTKRAEAPTQRNHATEPGKTHWGEPKPQHRGGQQRTQNTKHTEPQKPPNQKGRRRKENKSYTKETKRNKNKEGKGKHGNKEGEKKKRRADRPAQGRSGNESMVAWANHRNGTGKPRNPINGNVRQGPARAPVAAGTAAAAATQLEKEGTVTLTPTSRSR